MQAISAVVWDIGCLAVKTLTVRIWYSARPELRARRTARAAVRSSAGVAQQEAALPEQCLRRRLHANPLSLLFLETKAATA